MKSLAEVSLVFLFFAFYSDPFEFEKKLIWITLFPPVCFSFPLTVIHYFHPLCCVDGVSETLPLRIWSRPMTLLTVYSKYSWSYDTVFILLTNQIFFCVVILEMLCLYHWLIFYIIYPVYIPLFSIIINWIWFHPGLCELCDAHFALIHRK